MPKGSLHPAGRNLEPASRQQIETSRDGGTSGHAGFDARHRKHG
jgi:hypothetical protein